MQKGARLPQLNGCHNEQLTSMRCGEKRVCMSTLTHHSSIRGTSAQQAEATCVTCLHILVGYAISHLAGTWWRRYSSAAPQKKPKRRASSARP